MAIFELDLPTDVVAHSLADAAQLAEKLADDVSQALRFAIETDGVASLVVSGGRSPIPFFEALSRRDLDWSRVQVSLADERWVPVGHADSNEGLVRRHLMVGEAAKASFFGLYRPASTVEAAARQAAQGLAEFKQPIDVLVLGMGDDGHTASLFPGNAALGQALDPACPETCMPMLAPAVPHQRITLTYPVLASAHLQCLSIQGMAKLDALERALGAPALERPIKAFLHSPLEIYWCP